MVNWADNIPGGGVLCWYGETITETVLKKRSTVILKDELLPYKEGDCHKAYRSGIGGVFIIPLTPQEWWQFAPWRDMDSAPKDGTLVALKTHDSLFDVGYSCGEDWEDAYGFSICDPIAWLPLPETSK